MVRTASALLVFWMLNSLSSASQPLWRPIPDTSATNQPIKVLPLNFYSTHLSFFCKKEIDLQKIRPGGIFFRLGTKEYVDALERKPNSYMRGK